jgi:hypothetical protein
LEFNLRLQEYIELVRLGKKTEAIQYVQKYLSSWSESHLRQLEQAMALLAFPKDTLCEPYKVREKHCKRADPSSILFTNILSYLKRVYMILDDGKSSSINSRRTILRFVA